MNMKENIFFSSSSSSEEWVNDGEVGKTDRTDLGKYIYITKYKETRKHKRFRQKIVFVRCKKLGT